MDLPTWRPASPRSGWMFRVADKVMQMVNSIGGRPSKAQS